MKAATKGTRWADSDREAGIVWVEGLVKALLLHGSLENHSLSFLGYKLSTLIGMQCCLSGWAYSVCSMEEVPDGTGRRVGLLTP